MPGLEIPLRLPALTSFPARNTPKPDSSPVGSADRLPSAVLAESFIVLHTGGPLRDGKNNALDRISPGEHLDDC